MGGKRKRGNGEISNQVQNYNGDGSGKHEKSNRFSEKNKIFFIRESERLGDKFYCRVNPGNSNSEGKQKTVRVSGEFELSG